jgi:hypothetical protein
LIAGRSDWWQGADEFNIRLDGAELDRWKWVDLNELETYVQDRIARRVRSIVETGAAYLEHGSA